MQVAFLRKFSKDLDRITQPKDRKAIAEVIGLIKQTSKFEEISGTKKLTGFDDAYRIRCGHYRIGVFVNGDIVLFARVAHRKDIYKVFP
jgi:mRNA interferase RelE/StbE